MNVSVIGTGYVGLVTGACLADAGNNVLCFDVDTEKIATLQAGRIPIYEPGLDAMVERNMKCGRLRFTTDEASSAKHGQVQFIAVGTPPNEDGSADLTYVLNAARGIGRHLDSYAVIVGKSTVPVGTADKVKAVIEEELAQRSSECEFGVVSNPEFLKEGAALEDFLKPDRIVLGSNDMRATNLMRELYMPFQRNHERMIVMDVRSAELTKYAANAMLATRISFMNELANLAERVGADIESVRQGMGSDPRIGFHFLYAGIGYGGSCFPKDVKALQKIGQDRGMTLRIVDAVERANECQKSRLLEKLDARFGESVATMRVALWGLSFKPNTDDMREAPSLMLIEGLLKRGATVVAYDPVAIPEAKRILGDRVGLSFAGNAVEAVSGADVLMIATEWKEFRSPDFELLRNGLRRHTIFDGRNLYDPSVVSRYGLRYECIGRGVAG